MGAGRVLIVDDDERYLKLLSENLASDGYEVRPADSGELALAAVAKNPPELILLDMRMPGMDGIEVYKRLKTRPETQDIPVIFLSASTDFEDRLEGLEAGAVDYISKPFRREELLARLKTHLELARLRKDLELRVAERTEQLQAANDQMKHDIETRRQIEAELRESEQLFRSMADTAPVGIWISNREGHITYVSQWFSDFLPPSRDVAETWERFVHPGDVASRANALAVSVLKRKAHQIEYRLRRRDGEYRWLTEVGIPRMAGGEFVGHIGSVIDVTDLKRGRERALAHQKLESVGVLAAGVAHTFNNLVSTIIAHADLALDEIQEESPAYKSVSMIGKVAVRASEIVRLLMAYADQGDSDAPEPFELSSLIREVVQLLQASVSGSASFNLNLSKDSTVVCANAGQMRQVVLNLAINASEALEAQTGVVTISTSRVRVHHSSMESGLSDLAEGDYVLLEVSDTGCGMTEELQAKIFDPFFSTKFLGRGLGLFSAQGTVRGLDGAISVTSSPNKGSTFKVWLPLWTAESLAGPDEQRSGQGAEGSPFGAEEVFGALVRNGDPLNPPPADRAAVIRQGGAERTKH
jgi:PAS domain S-box-containing protein